MEGLVSQFLACKLLRTGTKEGIYRVTLNSNFCESHKEGPRNFNFFSKVYDAPIIYSYGRTSPLVSCGGRMHVCAVNIPRRATCSFVMYGCSVTVYSFLFAKSAYC
jgi:hypothetical protein